MSRFVLTAQLQLQAPNNVAQVVRQIQNQLNNVSVNVQVQGAAQAQRQLQQVTAQTQAATSAVDRMGRAFAVSVRRFAAFSIATRAVSLFTSTLSDAIKTAIDFEREMVRVSQVTGESLDKLKGFSKTVTDLSTSLGVASSDLVQAGQLLLQAGISAKDTEVALKTLAKAALAPNFDSLSETTEGAIAILAQFGEGVGALEKQLGSINAVAGAFAVEAGDLIDVIRRTGGVFRASGGDLNELIALFTSVRATTRESAESIGTGLRTIFTRIQRPKTIEFLKQFGVELVDLNGKFVGPFEAVKRLSGALAGLGQGDLTFIRIAEELGGFRQIGKVLPLLQQFSVAQNALNVANKAGNSLTNDAATAQQALAVRIIKVKEEFLALVRGITETKTFQIMANTALSLASALIQIGDAIKPLLPMLAAIAAVNLAKNIGPFLGSFARGMGSNRTFNKGGKVHHFARGGMVPGSGNRDTVPAMLSPGEFVIRKSSVNKLGANNLAAMNENKFAVGGIATKNMAGMAIPDTFGKDNLKTSTVPVSVKDIATATPQSGMLKSGSLSSLYALKSTKTVQSTLPNKLPISEFNEVLKTTYGFGSKSYSTKTAGVSNTEKKRFNDILSTQMREAIKNGASEWSTAVGVPLSAAEIKFGDTFSLNPGLAGTFFESVVDAFQGRPVGAEASENKRPFDFINGLRGGANARLFGGLNDVDYIDAKKSVSLATDSEYRKKISSQLALDGADDMALAVSNRYKTLLSQRKHFGGIIQKFAKGGMAQPLVDDILSNAPNAILPRPGAALQKLIQAGGGFVDIDRTLKRTIGDQAYARARTEKERQAVLSKYFTNSRNRLNDIKTAGLTQFGTELQNSIKSGQLSGSSIRVISKSPNTPGVAEYLSSIFGIPSRNFAFTGGRNKVPLMRRFATGGGVGTDTVPALLTPGEFVVNRSSAQRIGYGNLNRMNKVGKYAKGGIVHRFNQGGTAPVLSGGGNLIPFDTLSRQARNLANAQQLLTRSTQTSSQSMQQNADIVDQSIGSNNLFRSSIIATAPAILQGFLPALDEASSGITKVAHYLLSLATTLTSVNLALQSFGVSLNIKQIAQLFGSGPGGLGGMIKNAFSGFKMGAAGMAGPQPLGGGIASRAGSMFQKAKDIISPKLSYTGTGFKRLDNSLDNISNSFRKGFSGGKQGISPLFSAAMPPGTARMPQGTMAAQQLQTRIGGLGIGGRLAARAGGFLGSATSQISESKFGQGVKLGSTNQFPLKDILFGPGKAGFSGRLGGVIGKGGGLAGDAFGRFSQGMKLGSTNQFSLQNILFGKGGKAGFAGRLGGIIGKGGGLAARAGGALGGLAGGAGSAALAAAGPISAITGLVSIINGAIGAFRDLDGQLQKSIQAGKVEEASKLAVAKAATDFPLIGNIIGGWSETIDQGLINIMSSFGGSTLDSIKALAASQAGAVKTQKELDKAQQVATQAMQDFENGTISASDALSKIRASSNEVINQEKRSSDFAIKNLGNRASDGFTGRNVASFLTFGAVESSSQRNQRLGQQNIEQINQAAKFEAQRFQMESPARAATIRSGLFKGQSKSEIETQAMGGLRERRTELLKKAQTALRAGDTDTADAFNAAAEQLRGEIEQVEREMVNLDKEVTSAKDKFNALNLGLRNVTAAADASALRMTKAMNSFDLAVVPGTNAMATLEAALTSAGQNISQGEFDASLAEVSGILRKFGANAEQAGKFEDLAKGVATVQRDFPNIFETLKKRLESGELKKMAPEDLGNEFKKIVGESLDKANIGPAAKKRIMDSMGNVQIDDKDMAKIIAGDISVLEKYIGDAAEEVSKNIKAFGEKWISANQELIKATQERIEAERNLVAAQREAIDLYMEGRDIQAKYGGQAVSTEERRAANLAKINAGSSRMGLAQMRTGSLAELRARNNSIVTGVGAIEARRGGPNSEMGAAGAEAQGVQQNLLQAQKEQIQFIRDEIKIREDELKIIQEKNKLEKDSLESLITGDIEKFFEQQAAMGAQAAIATGDRNAANMFGGKAVAMAFQDIQRQMEAGVQTMFGRQLGGPGGLAEQAAGAALGARGVMDPRMAQRLAGTTPEEEALKSTLRELGTALGETGAIGAAMAEMQVQTAEMKIDQANLVISNLDTGGAPAQGRAMGGLIYANRGMFIPRGTDTVPAMLTPGEFVVRREAVNRGNNLQLLRAINNGGGSNGFARGGKVGYYNNGGIVQYKALGDLIARAGQAIGIDPKLINSLSNVFTSFTNSFNESIKNLQNTKLNIKLDSVNVNVNFGGKSVLTQISEETRKEIISVVINKLRTEYGVGNNGKITENTSNLARPGQGM